MRSVLGSWLAPLLIAGAVFAAAGCGQVGPKQVRIESESVASTATEGATIASELGRGRLPSRYARIQLKTLAASAGGPASALGKTAPTGGSAALAGNTQALALESQRRLNDLAEYGDDPKRRAVDHARLNEIARRASTIADNAEAIE